MLKAAARLDCRFCRSSIRAQNVPLPSGWEEKHGFVSFRLVKLTRYAAYFSGLTYRRVGPDQLDVYVVVEHDGKRSEEKLVFRRVGSAGPAKAD